MTDEEYRHMVDVVTASTLANKAMLACFLADKPVTVENCALAAGPWLKLDTAHGERLVKSFIGHIESVLRARDRLSPSGSEH